MQMRNFGVVLSVALAVILPSALLAADEVEWKPESEQSALQFLKKCREAMGGLQRFEIEYLRSDVDTAFESDQRSRVKVYCERSMGCLFECRPIDPAYMQTSRRNTPQGRLYSVRSETSETWLVAGGLCTVLDEKRRTFEGVKIPPDNGAVDLFLAQQGIPPWFDPSIAWKLMESRLRVESAQSTTSEFRIELVRRAQPSAKPSFGWHLFEDDRLDACQTIVIDRQTLRPKKWWMVFPQGNRERILVYKRFDLNPAHRELKVDLTGYTDATKTPQPTSEPETKSALNMQTLELGARVLWCLLF
jgi:hypothetical protein